MNTVLLILIVSFTSGFGITFLVKVMYWFRNGGKKEC